ncbi:TagF domain-containing protein [Cupriavidus taiwanensis]|uniref:TagF domain-containing protein n=1 Tax=Cupriavidus taiwanensis TaxID=164546 RepID=UPI000E1FDD0F|nr:TagF domain-containing protein [Cupriavidus taiwanensis]
MSREIRVITAPSIFGKLPGLGDFVRHNAPLDQVQVWRSWFDCRNDDFPARAAPQAPGGQVRHWLHLTPPSLSGHCRLRPSEPCLFILRPGGLQFPCESSYLLGVVAASHDRVGRRYPLVVWQTASAQWAGHILAAPAQWLTELAQLVHDHTRQADRTSLAAAVDALWDRHRPGWRDRIQLSLKRLSAASRLAGAREAPDCSVVGPRSMRDDWPAGLLCRGSLGSVWQSAARCAFEIDGVPSIRRMVAGL